MTQELEILPTAESNGMLEAIERASIDMQITTAKKYPRSLSKVKADMTAFATLDEETAQSCFYTLPRGGRTIQGPSVRLAEIAVSCYQNLRAGARVISTVTHGDTPHVIVQAVAHDLQNNVAITIEKRRRITKKRSKDAIDEDDINLACNACASIAFRDAVFKVVPQALIKPVYENAKMVAVGDIKSLGKRRQQVVDRLKQMGVFEDRMLARVSARKVDDIGPEELATLIGLGTALKDGEITLEDAFPAVVESSQFVGGDKEKDNSPDSARAHDDLETALLDNELTESEFLKWCVENRHATKSAKSIRDIPADKALSLVKNITSIAEQIKKHTS